MPKALVINPNTSAEMTTEIKATAGQIFQPPWTYVVSSPSGGPESLESWTDYHIASVCVLPLLEQHADADGVVLACFGDPGVYMLKELCAVPVVGVAEASMSMALLLGAKFGILAGMRRAVELMDSMVRTYGLEPRYSGTQSLEMRVLEFERDRAKTLDTLESAGLALRKGGAEVLRMPIIEPVAARCRMVKSLVSAGLETSHAGLYARPAPQRMNNLESVFSKGAIQAIDKPR